MATPGPRTQPGSSAAGLAQLRARLAYIYNREIWQSSVLKDGSPKGILYAVLRVLSITVTVFFESRVTSRAAALSFSSLLGLGPLIAIAVLIGGFVLGDESDEVIAKEIGRVITLVAPQLTVDTAATEGRPSGLAVDGSTPLDGKSVVPPSTPGRPAVVKPESRRDVPEKEAEAMSKRVNPAVIEFVQGIISGARSASGAGFGVFTLISIVLLLFSTIEDAFNDIWGVRQGRSLLVRVVFYWTILTLGAVIFFAAIASLGAGAFVNVFEPFFEDIPGGKEMFKLLKTTLPLISMTVVAALLTLMYRVVPNTRVLWKAAAIGGVVVMGLLVLNSYGAAMYVKRVILTKSLYGSVALPLVLMFGLYFFWLFLLIGGIVSYAVQNVHFRNSQAAWSMLPGRTRERLSLVVFLTICRRFRECLPPMPASRLSEMLKVPTQLVNECLGRLDKLKLVTPVVPNPDETENDPRYVPSKPLNRMTLFDFKTLDDTFGENPLGSSLEHLDPLLSQYDRALAHMGENEFFQKTVDELLAASRFDQAPPATGDERPTA